MSFKKSLFSLFLQYCAKSPLALGKGALTRFIGNQCGYAEYDIGNVKLELNPTALLDQYLIEDSDINPILSNEMKLCLNKDSYFLDIGANIGYFSLLAAVKYKAQVLAFEPSPRELSRFYRNIALNSCNRILCFPYGVGAKEENLYLNLTDFQNPSMNFISKEPTAESISVLVKPIDQLVNTHILEGVKLCKIDVEGFEMEVLQGMKSSFNAMRGCHYVIEVSPEYLKKANATVEQVYDFFGKRAYKPLRGKQNAFQWDEVFVPAQ